MDKKVQIKFDNKRFHLLDEFIRNGIEKNRNQNLHQKHSFLQIFCWMQYRVLFEFFILGTSGTYLGSSLSAFLLFRSTLNCEIASRLPSCLNPQGLTTEPKTLGLTSPTSLLSSSLEEANIFSIKNYFASSRTALNFPNWRHTPSFCQSTIHSQFSVLIHSPSPSSRIGHP